jgi:NAD(P)-dependent dehydrogenase (short-subunit alcohol dehydrogenase family)
MRRLKARRVLITGGASGIGAAKAALACLYTEGDCFTRRCTSCAEIENVRLQSFTVFYRWF